MHASLQKIDVNRGVRFTADKTKYCLDGMQAQQPCRHLPVFVFTYILKLGIKHQEHGNAHTFFGRLFYARAYVCVRACIHMFPGLGITMGAGCCGYTGGHVDDFDDICC
jgi:hypothetical protein